MNTFVAFLRGINVGGHSRLPMKDLIAAIERVGGHDVKTYIQSGNAVFESSKKDRAQLSEQLAPEIEKGRGFKPHVLILELDAVAEAIERNPFPEAEADPKNLHLGFLSSAPQSPNLEKLEDIRKQSERFRFVGSVFYLYAPDGVGRSKLSAASEKLLGVPMTDRNWNTVCKMREMASG